jgi:hypothetical protein
MNVPINSGPPGTMPSAPPTKSESERQEGRYASRKWRGFVGLCILWTIIVCTIPFLVDAPRDIASLTELARAWMTGVQILFGTYCTANVVQYIGGGATIQGRSQP